MNLLPENGLRWKLILTQTRAEKEMVMNTLSRYNLNLLLSFLSRGMILRLFTKLFHHLLEQNLQIVNEYD
jgi:hypothetical protein